MSIVFKGHLLVPLAKREFNERRCNAEKILTLIYSDLYSEKIIDRDFNHLTGYQLVGTW